MSAPLGRRAFVTGAAALAAAPWPSRHAGAATGLDFEAARHLLSRTGFGGTPAEIRALEGQDGTAAVDRLLAAPRRQAMTLRAPSR